MTFEPGVLDAWRKRAHPRGVDVVDAASLTPERFHLEYVARNRPCLLKGALRSWPAFERWNDVAYLKEKLAGCHIPNVLTRPSMELRWRVQRWGEPFAAAYAAIGVEAAVGMPAAEFLDRIARGELLFCYAAPLTEESVFLPLADDLEEIELLGDAPDPRFYDPWRVFFFGKSYTDWHLHPTDETLMCQLGAPKQVALLAPDQDTWDALIEVAKEQVTLGVPDPSRFPRAAALRPIVFTVEPGDATYIPPFWWHCVETLPDGPRFGTTLARCWGTPPHIDFDPRFPTARDVIRHGTDSAVAERLQLALTHWLPAHLRGEALERIPSL